MIETLQKKLKSYRCALCNHMKVERKCCLFQWIGSVLGDKVPNQDFETVLKDGTILCRLMNKIQPGSIKKFRETVIFSFHFNKLICSCTYVYVVAVVLYVRAFVHICQTPRLKDKEILI